MLLTQVNDEIYGPIQIPSDIYEILNTPQFQRLKSIKQLGLLHFSEPNANHSRYDHSLGTFWRAKMMLDSLERNTPNMVPLPSLYRRAVEIAALLHDIGHGPFSHTWERKINSNYHHELNSFPCIDVIFAQLSNSFCDLRNDNNYGIELIKALIVGEHELLSKSIPNQYRFIFEVVNNKQCKLDVDKWDYLKRDHHYLKHIIAPNMDFDSVFLNARVSSDGFHIEYNYKDYEKIYLIFEARWKFHVHCYRAPITSAFDVILSKIIKGSKNLKINGKEICDISANDIASFLELTDDNVLKMIENHTYSVYLKEPSRIKHETLKEMNLSLDDMMNGFISKEEFIAPGSEMPADGCFFFYGNESDKPEILRNQKDFHNIHKFVLM